MQSIRSLMISAGLILAVATSASAARVSGPAPASRGGASSTSSTTTTAAAPTASTQPAPLPASVAGVGVMVNLNSGTYTTVNQFVYQFDSNLAANRFSNTFNGTVECVDQTGSACSLDGAPPAPAPDPSQLAQAAAAQACTFLDGGSLQASSYQQMVVISPVPYDYTYRMYQYQFDVTPIAPAVPARFGWRNIGQRNASGVGASMSVTGQIANELVTYPQPGVPMYAFMTGSLVAGLQLYVDNNPVPVLATAAQNCAGCKLGQYGSRDFSFVPNVGTSGDAMAAVKSGDARTILNSDAYSANDNGGSTGSALQQTLVQSQKLSLAPGSHSVLLMGTSAGTSFMVSGNIQVLSPGCSGQ